jgi:AcrR family transcriptional regulator
MTSQHCESGRSDGEKRAGRKPRADGVESRRAILHAAANLATTRGLEGLSIGELAEHIGMSKSGLYAHFKSKEELELATIETAAEIFEGTCWGEPVARRSRAVRALARRSSGTWKAGVSGRLPRATVSARLHRVPGARDRVMEVQQRGSHSLPGLVRPSQE